MKIICKREILVDREPSVMISFGSSDSRFLTIDEAAIVCGLSSRQVFRLVEQDEIHSVETNQGLTLVCLASPSNSQNQRPNLKTEAINEKSFDCY